MQRPHRLHRERKSSSSGANPLRPPGALEEDDFLSVHQAAVAHIKANPEEALQLTAAETGLPLETVRQMLPWYDFDPTIRPSDIAELKRTQDFLIQNGMLKKSIEIEKIIAKIQ